MEPGSDDPLARFLVAQQGVYRQALAELARGAKESHWMWFIFPQIAGLGTSATSRFYAIRSKTEARAYLAHPVLGARLIECTAAVLAHPERAAVTMFGPVDAAKLMSSMTLFEAAAMGSESRNAFERCLTTFFSGVRDGATLKLLAPQDGAA